MEKAEFLSKVKKLRLNIEEANLYLKYCKKHSIDCATYFDYVVEMREYKLEGDKIVDLIKYYTNIPLKITVELYPLK